LNKNIWVYDIETLKSCFTYTAVNVETSEQVQFVLHKDKFEILELIQHLNECKGQIGFNNVNFDYPIIHKLLTNWKKWLAKYRDKQELIITELYEEAQRIIEEQNNENFNQIVAIKQYEVIIPQMDLFKMWHFNNKARRTSLKALEISMNFPNVMEMPIDHNRDDITLEEIPSILEYNLNDVLATLEFYKKSFGKIDLRKGLNEKYNLKCINFPDSKIGEQLILKLYCDYTGKDPWEVKKQRTYRNYINLNECIFPYIEFESIEFNNLLNKFKSTVIRETKNALKESVIYKGFKYEYGLGGIHGCIKAGVYEADDDYIIIDADVGSLYPNIAIKNGLYIEHLGKDFITVYDDYIVKPRLAAKKAGDTIMADGFKLSANSVYGKSNDVNSFLYDPKYTMQTTVNGQLLLTMLAEKLVDMIPNLQILQINTDGITVKIKKGDIWKYQELCKSWENLTKLNLEYVEYSKMVIRDVYKNIGVLTF